MAFEAVYNGSMPIQHRFHIHSTSDTEDTKMSYYLVRDKQILVKSFPSYDEAAVGARELLKKQPQSSKIRVMKLEGEFSVTPAIAEDKNPIKIH
jgi:hypothetical protein